MKNMIKEYFKEIFLHRNLSKQLAYSFQSQILDIFFIFCLIIYFYFWGSERDFEEKYERKRETEREGEREREQRKIEGDREKERYR